MFRQCVCNPKTTSEVFIKVKQFISSNIFGNLGLKLVLNIWLFMRFICVSCLWVHYSLGSSEWFFLAKKFFSFSVHRLFGCYRHNKLLRAESERLPDFLLQVRFCEVGWSCFQRIREEVLSIFDRENDVCILESLIYGDLRVVLDFFAVVEDIFLCKKLHDLDLMKIGNDVESD